MLGKTYLNLGEKSHNHKKFEASLRHRGFFPPPLTRTPACRHRTANIGSGSRELNKGEQVPRPARSSGARRARTAALAEGACEASQPSRQQRCAGTRLRAERGAGASRGQRNRGRLPGYPSTASRAAGTQTSHLRGRAAHRPPPHSSSPPRPPSLHPSLPPYGRLFRSRPAPALLLPSSDTAGGRTTPPTCRRGHFSKGPRLRLFKEEMSLRFARSRVPALLSVA